MSRKLVVNYGEFEFYNFDKAVTTLEEEYGYECLAWNMVINSSDFGVMCEFLNDDGVDAEII